MAIFSISQVLDMTKHSRGGFLKETRGPLNKYHEIILNDDYVIVAQLWMRPFQQYTHSDGAL